MATSAIEMAVALSKARREAVLSKGESADGSHLAPLADGPDLQSIMDEDIELAARQAGPATTLIFKCTPGCTKPRGGC